MNAMDFVLAGSLLTGGVFLTAGISKLFSRSRPQHIKILSAIGFRSTLLLRILVGLLPIVEILLGIWLLSNRHAFAGLIFSSLVFSVFVIVLLAAVRKNYNGPCACFGTGTNGSIGVSHIATNVFLLGISLLTSYFAYSDSAEVRSISTLKISDVGVVLLLIVLLLAIRFMLNQMENLFSQSTEKMNDK